MLPAGRVDRSVEGVTVSTDMQPLLYVSFAAAALVAIVSGVVAVRVMWKEEAQRAERAEHDAAVQARE